MSNSPEHQDTVDSQGPQSLPAPPGSKPPPPASRPQSSASPQALEFHRKWTGRVIEAVELISRLDRSQGVFVSAATARLASPEQTVTRDGVVKKPRAAFDIEIGQQGKSYGQAKELGCSRAFFVPEGSASQHTAGNMLPPSPPKDWVPLGRTMESGLHESQVLMHVPEHMAGILGTGSRGTILLQPNTPTEILRERYEALRANPSSYPISVAHRVLNFREEDVVIPHNPPIPGLPGEQSYCVAFAMSNPVTFIWGPPGTGKSVTLTETISAALQRGKRVLVLAVANDALDSIAEKIYGRYLAGGDRLLTEAVESGRVTRYGVTHRTRHYKEISYSLKVKRARANGQVPPSSAESMSSDLLSFSTFYRFLHLEDLQYDMVVVDEAGAVNLPFLYLSATAAYWRMVVCGDPRQTQPIFGYSARETGKEIARLFSMDIYRHNGLRINPEDAPDARLCALTVQRRMTEEIAQCVVDTRLYRAYTTPADRRMSKSEQAAVECPPMPHRGLVLVDTSSMVPKTTDNSNRVHFEVGKILVEHAAAASRVPRVGVVCPYSNQAKLYREWIRDNRLAKIQAGTVHAFQGSEAPYILFDITESPRTDGKPSHHTFTDEVKTGADETINVLNVAVSRAKSKLVLLGNVDYMLSRMSPDCYLNRLVERLSREGAVIPAEVVLEKLGRRLGGETDASAYFSKSPNDVPAQEFWAAFSSDLQASRLSIDVRGKHVDREFVYNLAGHLRKVARRSGLVVNFYIAGHINKDDRAYLRRLVEEDAHFHLKKGAEWTYGKLSYLVFDGKVSYESHDRGTVEFLQGLIPVRTLRLVFSRPLR